MSTMQDLQELDTKTRVRESLHQSNTKLLRNTTTTQIQVKTLKSIRKDLKFHHRLVHLGLGLILSLVHLHQKNHLE